MNPSSRPNLARPVDDLPRFEKKRGLTIVELPADGIIKPDDVERVCSIIEQAIEQSPDHHNFVLCFRHVKYMSSLFIGRLMGFYKRLDQKHAQLMLCEMHEQLVTVIRLARLQKQMAIYPNRAQAITGRTPAVTGIITSTAIAGIAGVVMLIKHLTYGYDHGPGTLHWIAVIYLLVNLPLPVLAWVTRRKISSYRLATQWGTMALAYVLMIMALLAATC